MFGEYPRKPLTSEQERENEDWYARRDAAKAEYHDGKADLRADLSKKYGIEWEEEIEGDWCVEGYAPHSAKPDFDAFTDDDRRNWETERAMNEAMKRSMSDLLLDRISAIPSLGTTIRWVRYAGVGKKSA